MAEVYRARDESLDRDVAIKVILPDLTAESQFLQRFETEAKLVASLDHPNILPIFDFGEHDGQPYVVMPFVPGGTLAEYLQNLADEGRKVPLPQALDWSRQIASALDAAHEAGVLHRDVKPGNILIGRQNRLFLADFGIARLYDATARLTRTGTVVGTPLYMAPEVAGGANAGTASDLYSLAVIVYEMLAGKPPFDGENLLAILNQHATRPVPPLADHDPRMPSEIDGALERGLAKLPEERPPSCTDFVTLLQSSDMPLAAAGVHVSNTARTLPLPSSESSTVPAELPTAMTPLTVTQTIAPAKQWAMAGLAGALVAMAGFFLMRWWEPRTIPDPTSTPVPESETIAAVEPSASATDLSSPPPAPATELDEPPPPRPDRAGPDFGGPPGGPPPGGDDGGLIGLRLAEIRSFRRRSSEEDFRGLLSDLELLRANQPAGPAVALRHYGEGALAYIEGRHDEATAILLRLIREPRFLRLYGPSPLTWIADEAEGEDTLDDWQLAIGYVDPLGELGAILDRRESAAGNDPRWSLARALVHRLDGEPEAVLERALPVWESGKVEDVPAEVRSYLALLIAEAHHDVGKSAEALPWYQRAVDAGGIHTGMVAGLAAGIARELRQLPEALAFLRQACEADHRPACQELRRVSGRGRFPRRP